MFNKKFTKKNFTPTKTKMQGLQSQQNGSGSFGMRGLFASPQQQQGQQRQRRRSSGPRKSPSNALRIDGLTIREHFQQNTDRVQPGSRANGKARFIDFNGVKYYESTYMRQRSGQTSGQRSGQRSAQQTTGQRSRSTSRSPQRRQSDQQ